MRLLLPWALLLLALPARADVFSDAGVEGTFVLHRLGSDTLTAIHPDLAARRFLPASTFKVPNAVIALETDAVTLERSTMRWDGKDRGRPEVNADQDLASAIEVSALWYFQEVARRVGAPRMRKLVRAFGYGNQVTGPALDRFWIDGTLRISPLEQVAFLRKLRALELPVDRRHQETVARLIELDRRGARVLRGKTGLGFQDGQAVGWLVGWVDGDDPAVYALLVLAPGERSRELIPLRRQLLDELLAAHGVFPGP
jgi:beta-lactamase class D